MSVRGAAGRGSTLNIPGGLAIPTPTLDGLDAAYWEGAANHELVVQRCGSCHHYQWGPEYVCHRCQSMRLGWARIQPTGLIYSYARVWHPVTPELAKVCPYVVVLVELPHAEMIRLVGNLTGDARRPVQIGASVDGIFEDHETQDGYKYTLIQWQRADA
jgi:uncharacterized OB-fold protein